MSWSEDDQRPSEKGRTDKSELRTGGLWVHIAPWVEETLDSGVSIGVPIGKEWAWAHPEGLQGSL